MQNSDSAHNNRLKQLKSDSERISSIGRVVREFFVDVLGSLVPGLIFTVTAASLVRVSLLYIRSYAPGPPAIGNTTVLEELWKALESGGVWTIIVMSYVIGCVFHRQDPKIPDQISAELVLRGISKDELKRSEIQEVSPLASNDLTRWAKVHFYLLTAFRNLRTNGQTWLGWTPHAKPALDLPRAWQLSRSSGAQFPYSHMKQYLETRALQHLAALVPWSGDRVETVGARTKMFINILKIRLHLFIPDLCVDLVRNEAHVRMMSSLWYAGRALRRFALLLLVPPIVLWPFNTAVFWKDFAGFSLLSASLYTAAFWLQRSIVKSFHYQRVREVVYVLEMAYSAAKAGWPEVLTNLVVDPTNTSSGDDPVQLKGPDV